MKVNMALEHYLCGASIVEEKVTNVYVDVTVQWNLRTRDTLGLIVLSLVERPPLSQKVPYRRFHCS